LRATWTSRLGSIANDQLPYALSQAINDVAKAAAEEAREEANKTLNVKRKSFLNAFIRAPAEHRATKTKLSARVAVMAPKSARSTRGSILTQHETAGTKTPTGGKYVAMPGRSILRNVGGKRSVLRGMELRNLKPFTKTAGGKLKGRKQTFMIKTRSGTPLLLQSQGKKARVVWVFVRKSGLTAKLGFGTAVRRRVDRDFTKAVGTRLTQAIASARPVTQGGGVTSTRLYRAAGEAHT
jgi:hypothetical protein